MSDVLDRQSAMVPQLQVLEDDQLLDGHHPSGNFPGIADYAFLSDCESNCLIAPSGAVEWMCMPRPDSPCVFTAILDRGGGSFRVGPFGVKVPAARRYLPGTLVLETTWQTPTGWLVVRDALIMAPWHNTDQRSKTHRRSPTDFDAAHCLLRVVKCVNGTVELATACEPVFDYARKGGRWEYTGDDYAQVVTTAEDQPTLKLTSSVRLGIEGRIAMCRPKMSSGEWHYVALSLLRAGSAEGRRRGRRLDGAHEQVLAPVAVFRIPADGGSAHHHRRERQGVSGRAHPEAAARPTALGTGLLSDRELEVAELLLRNQTYREIGQRLFISPKTVEHHVARMKQRIGASGRSELFAELRTITGGSTGRR